MTGLNSVLAQKTVRDYVCAQCWGTLISQIEGTESVVECVKDPEHQGFVTRKWADQQCAQSGMDKIEVDRMLQNVGVLPKLAKRLEAEILAELGF